LFILDLFALLVGILLSVAFYTLLERKVIGFVQFRKGPAKLLIIGVSQPFSDALKLFFKGVRFLNYLLFRFFLVSPFLGLILLIILWFFFPSWAQIYGRGLEVILFFSILSLTPYFIFLCGYSSSSVYSKIGFVRSISQTISYEVVFVLYILIFVFYFIEIKPSIFQIWEEGRRSVFIILPFFLIWIFISITEANRSPFDFSEGESELVSGFNVEYFGGLFSVIFITEYGIIIFIRFVGSLIFFRLFSLLIFMVFFCFLYVLVRCCYPRFRYDYLILCSWISILPMILVFIFITIEFIITRV